MLERHSRSEVIDGFAACAAEIAAAPDLVRRILEAHRPDADGWCRAHDAHRERHPCSIRTLAELARDPRTPGIP